MKWNDLCYVPWTSQIVKLDLSKRSFHDVLNEWQWIFQFHQVQNENCSQAFFLVLGSYDVKRSWNSTFDFYTFLPSVCSVQLQSYTFSAPSYFCSYTVYVWGQIISEVEVLYIKPLQIHVRLKTFNFEVESLFLWAFVLALVKRMTAAEIICLKGKTF